MIAPTHGIPPGLAATANGRDALPTNEAAKAINRRDQTLRKWACLENGPIRPLRINGRLAWKVADLAKLLNEGSFAPARTDQNALLAATSAKQAQKIDALEACQVARIDVTPATGGAK